MCPYRVGILALPDLRSSSPKYLHSTPSKHLGVRVTIRCGMDSSACAWTDALGVRGESAPETSSNMATPRTTI